MNRRYVFITGMIMLIILITGGCSSISNASTPTHSNKSETASIQSDTGNATAPAATQSVDPTMAQAGATAAPSGNGLTTFQIAQDQSQASFTIFEELRGSPNTVVGTTSQVTGQVEVNPSDLSSTKISVITIDAKTLVTDESLRNRAINNFILHTGQYPNITFTPGQITGLSGSATPGKTYQFKIAGDLTIQDVTKPVIFDVTAKEDSPTQISGSATSTIQRSDFNLQIPNIPFVANVGQDVKLELNFVLTPTNQ